MLEHGRDYISGGEQSTSKRRYAYRRNEVEHMKPFKNLVVLSSLLFVMITSCVAGDTPLAIETSILTDTPLATRTAGIPTDQNSSGLQYTDDNGRVLPTPFPPTPMAPIPQRSPTPGIPPVIGQDATPDPDLLVPHPTMPYTLDFPSREGNSLRGTYYPVLEENTHSILFIHMLGGDRHVWRELAMEAQELGFSSLAIDLQGHGESSGQAGLTLMESDIDGALTWLLNSDESHASTVIIVGASASANLALDLASSRYEISGIALISPLPHMKGKSLVDQLESYGEGRWFLAVADDDPFTLDKEATTELIQASQGYFITYPGFDHATNLLQKSDQLKADLLDWLASFAVP
jgi:pimeloyl-ACP methyl ester carboxylesterase